MNPLEKFGRRVTESVVAEILHLISTVPHERTEMNDDSSLRSNAIPLLWILLLVGLIHFFGKGAHSEHEATVRIERAVQAVEDRLPRPPGTMGLPQIERYAEGLRTVDSTGAPEPLRSALSNYAAAVERHRDRLRDSNVWDTNTAGQVEEAQGEFRKTLKTGF